MEIVLLEDLAADALLWLRARHQVDYLPELADDLSALHRRIYKTAALLVPPRLMVNSQLLDFAPKLKVVARVHDSTDNIDFEACQRRGIRVVQASSATVRASAEYLLSTLLQIYRQGVRTRREPGQPVEPRVPGREINDSVVGLLGMSPPAHLLATMLVALGARVVGYDPAIHRSADLWRRLGVQPLSLPELLGSADAVSLQMIYATRYQGLLNEHALIHCKPGQVWTTISRPALFDLKALADALRAGRIRGVMMDSDDAALRSPESPLNGLNHLRITPRLAPFTEESRLRASWYLVDRMHETLMLSEFEASHDPEDSQPLSMF
ncbi:NAD(P)-dependent oxidoreductase [Ottowia sp.]|uniref:NAD(P)-dependent oxidoreductase n=1 Tax=Ottowia sp. TaxID=1898956 RepID=UPI003A87B89E